MGGHYTSWILNDKTKEPKLFAESGDNLLSFNIFGHAPQYFNPTFYRNENTLHVNLDISKIEANTGNYNSSNNTSFAFLVIDGREEKLKISLIGRIKFPESSPNGLFTATTNRLSDIIKFEKTEDYKKVSQEKITELNEEKKEIMKKIHMANAYTNQETVNEYA